MTMTMDTSSTFARVFTSLLILATLTVPLSLPTAYGFHHYQLALPSLPRTTTIGASRSRGIIRWNWKIIPIPCSQQHLLFPTIITSSPLPSSSSRFSLSISRENNNNIVTEGQKNVAEIRNIANHLASQPLNSLLSASEAKAIMNELFFFSDSNRSSDPSSNILFTERSYAQYVKYWNRIESRLRREEKRTPADLLGTELTSRILSSIRGDGNGGSGGGMKNGKNGNGMMYDAQTVRTFLESDAINSLFTRLLYDAIFEFTTKFDILGNAVSNLPLLGPVRNQVLKESKRNMDRTLGPLLRTFISGYTRVAIQQSVEFVVSEENASAFGKANAKLVTYFLDERTVAEWIPDSNVMSQWREELWAYLVGLEGGEEEGSGTFNKNDQKKVLEQSIDWIYDILGDKCVEDGGVQVEKILDASPTLVMSLGRFWQQCQDYSVQPLLE